MSHLVQREHPQNWGGIGVGSLGSAKNLQYLRNGAIEYRTKVTITDK